MYRFRIRAAASALILASTFAAGASRAQTAEPDEFYRGKTIRLIVGYPAGGGFDAYARLVARFLPAALPGNPAVVVQNMPGVGSLTAANYVYSTAPKDGTAIGMSGTAPSAPLLGVKAASFDPTQFNWIGSPNSETGLVVAWHAAPFATIDDVRQRELTIGNASINSDGSFYARVLTATLGLKFKHVFGYPGSNEAFLAMERGEVQGISGVYWSSLRSAASGWLADGKLRLLVQFGPKKNADLADVPFAEDMVENAYDRAVLKAAVAALAFGRPFMLPPNAPAERVAALRNAMTTIFKDADLLADAAKQRLEIAPVSGEQLQSILEQVYASSPAIVARLRELSGAP